jgi:transglutaminase-like putative cysteine protease
MKYSVRHRTLYHYGQTMIGGQSIGHLTPRETPWQTSHSASVAVYPVPEEREQWRDRFANPVDGFTITSPHDTLEVISCCDVTVTVPEAPVIDEQWEAIVARTATTSSADDLDAQQFVLPSPFVPYVSELHELATGAFTAARPFSDALDALSHRIYDTFAFDPAFSDVSTPLEDVLSHRRGVCQDFAHLMIGALRSLGLAARYVSGYIATDPAPGEPKLVGTDASHAWCSVYVPGFGWLDADPTNNQIPPQRHVTVAWGRDYGDVAPLHGVVLGPASSQELIVEVDVVHRADGGV